MAASGECASCDGNGTLVGEDCPDCGGSGVCQACQGTGVCQVCGGDELTLSSTAGTGECETCGGTGDCAYCA